MDASYTITRCLLDKENIRDTVFRMVRHPLLMLSITGTARDMSLTVFRQMFAFDERDSEALVKSVYAPEVTINYDATLLGRGAEDMSSREWARRLEHLHDRYDTTQHIVHNLLVELPQPDSKGTVRRPGSCKVFAYAHGIFYKRDAEGRPTIMARRQGGHYDLELVRMDVEEEEGVNPWRIKVQNVRLDWQDKTGN
ncbi:hypothetical protein PG985_011373 [Apiospora marii]|uniref:SnoaL-like domain-containing protein n=1 Tax=Apiospora marii TaxID=335849 RepID=A0ABR1STI0_9PEZI